MKELREKEKNIEFTPHTELYFDEVTETKPIMCPISRKMVVVEVVKRISTRAGETPFMDITHCSAFGKRMPTCLKKCLDMLSYKHFEH